MMKLLCWLPGQGPFQTGLRRCLHDLLEGASIDYCASLNNLLFKLRYHAYRPETVVLLETDSKILDRLFEHRELFSGVPMVLLVDDEDDITLSKGHLLRPRFMTSLAGDPEPVKQVLCNLLRRQQLENQMAYQ